MMKFGFVEMLLFSNFSAPASLPVLGRCGARKPDRICLSFFFLFFFFLFFFLALLTRLS